MPIESGYESNIWEKWVKDADDKLLDVENRHDVYNIQKDINEITIPSLAGYEKQGCIYSIWVDNELKYIGKTKDIQKRLNEHLIAKSDSTSSQLKRISECKEKNQVISISFIKVPEKIRSSLEESLIDGHDLYKNGWNTRHG